MTFIKGHTINLGRPSPVKGRSNIGASIALKGRKMPWVAESNKKRRGEKHFNFGKHWTEEIKQKMSMNRKGLTAKENHPNWKGGITPFNLAERVRFRQTIQKDVFKRDNYSCVFCGNNENLTVDHIQSWADYTKLRFSMDNCRTLCQDCHYKITYGKPMSKEVKSWGHNFRRRVAKFV